MPKMNVHDLKSMVTHHFERQRMVLGLWQTLADHFYPERADFTTTRNVGTELSDYLVDSYPVLVRRDLANSFQGMLRDGEWYQLITGGGNDPDHSGKMYLQWLAKRLRMLMYDRNANFVRATTQGDHDYATFGQTVISVERNRNRDGLLYRNWHLRDCAWFDGDNGHVEGVMRKWAPPHWQAYRYFGKNVHSECAKKALGNDKFKNGSYVHIEIPSALYGDEQLAARYPYVSIWLDCEHEHIVEEIGINNRTYVVPRFQTIAGSPYAYSPATVAGLPDARCLQAMTHTLLEAGERYARPPLVGDMKAIRGDVNLGANGITWFDTNDERKRLQDVLAPLYQDKGGFPIGMDMRQSVVNTLASAFYINKISLPDTSREMTAYEVQERMKQYRRENLPLFSPIEAEYNGQLCELSLVVAKDAGLLGSMYDVPESLRERDIEFKFKSPLSDSEEEAKATLFQQMSAMLGEAATIDQNVTQNVNYDVAFRDAIMGIGAPAKWLNSIESVLENRLATQMEQAAQRQMMVEQHQASTQQAEAM